MKLNSIAMERQSFYHLFFIVLFDVRYYLQVEDNENENEIHAEDSESDYGQPTATIESPPHASTCVPQPVISQAKAVLSVPRPSAVSTVPKPRAVLSVPQPSAVASVPQLSATAGSVSQPSSCLSGQEQN